MTGSEAAAGHSDAVTLDSPLRNVVGGKTATALAKGFGMETVHDLLSHYPRRYARRGELTDLSALPLDENVTVIAEVLSVGVRSMKSRSGSIVDAKISDGTGIIALTWFNQPWRAQQLSPGMRGIFAGKVTDFNGTIQLAHPTYRTFEGDLNAENADPKAQRMLNELIPIYPATATVTSWNVQACVEVALTSLSRIPDPLPPEVRAEQGLLSQSTAIELIHRPKKNADWLRARDTLRYTEAFVLQCALGQQRNSRREQPSIPRVPVPGGFLERFDAALPFVLTVDQEIVAAEITMDLSQPSPMNRLVQGEVGSGKTVVALRAMLAVADSGGQTAFLAPTEVLAGQHLRSIVALLGPDLAAELVPTLLTGQLSAAEKRQAHLRAVSGAARIIIGTHALLSDAVTFFDLGLVVVDEQHRFGVEQREALRLKGSVPPHVLVLTATPIPRTIAMTVFGALDVSTIRMLPHGRQGIETFVVALADHPSWYGRVWARLAEELALGRQAFVVAPAITAQLPEDDKDVEPDEAGAAPLRNVETLLRELRQMPCFASARIEELHGRMPSDQKDAVMRAFAAGDIDLLVATTVIEVGVDVPNASAMVVMDADRFGVSQLHQLRGRVGRGSVPGLCLLVTGAADDSISRERVDAVAETLDGFELAELDLRLRREGNVLGSTQSGGRSALRLLRVATDEDIIRNARSHAAHLISGDPGIRTIPALREAVRRRLDDVERASLTKG